jgi:hypothetical protein
MPKATLLPVNKPNGEGCRAIQSDQKLDVLSGIVVDGGIRSARRPEAADRPDALLDPDAIAASYLHLVQQHRSAWTFELEVRPWVEKF